MSTQKIVSIKKINRKDRYDLTVSSTHNFFANGILIHNTSGRTGNVRWMKMSFWQKLLNKFGLYKPGYQIVSGTRKVLLDPDQMGLDSGWYAGTKFRAEVHDMFCNLDIRKNEVFYYEIAGYTDTGSLIMGEHGLSVESMKESGVPEKEYTRYGSEMRYTYGTPPGEYRVFVYRITLDGKDLRWHEVEARCRELGLETVPTVGILEVSSSDTSADIMNRVEAFTRGASSLDERHIREGVCLREELSDGRIVVYKYKSFLFCVLEGIMKNTDEYVDLEEIS